MSKSDVGSKESGQFFPVDLNVIETIAIDNGEAIVLASYIILARGSHAYGHNRATAWGANSVAKYLNISHRRADKILQQLQREDRFQQAVIAPFPDKMDEDKPPKRKGPGSYRWLIFLTDIPHWIYLPNVLVDGLKHTSDNESLLCRILTQAIDPLAHPKSPLGCLTLLLHLYAHHDLDCFAGVDPKCLRVDWCYANNIDGYTKTHIPDTPIDLYEITPDHVASDALFIHEAIPFIVDGDERTTLFWDCLQKLQLRGFLYQTVVIWNCDPAVVPDEQAHPWYTLYILDHHARKSEPYAQALIHTFAFKAGIMDRYLEFFGDDENNLNSGQFRYIAPMKSPAKAIGIFRLRFRPHTRDTAIGYAAETNRIDAFSRWLTSYQLNTEETAHITPSSIAT